MSLSVIVITKDEEAAIARTLDSVAWADEIVVVDSGSADRTVEIARERGAKVVVTPDWPGFGPQKNRALDLATGDWVLSLDADEWLTPASAEEIKATIGAGAGPAAYRFPRRSSFCGRFMRHSGWWPDYVVRLFRRGSARFSDDSVHERVIVDGALGTLREPIMHETFVDLDDLVEKMNRYSTLTAQQLDQAGKSAGLGRGGRARAVGVRPHVCVPRRIPRRPRRLHARAGHRRGHVLPLREAHAVCPQVMRRLELVEPTLEGYSGHCHALVASFARAAASLRIDLWSGRGSADMDFGPHVASIRCSGAGRGCRRCCSCFAACCGARADRRHHGAPERSRARRPRGERTRAARSRVPLLPLVPRIRAQALVPASDGRAAAGHRDPRHDRQRRGRVSPRRLRERGAAALPRARAGCEIATVPFRRLLYAGAARQDKGFRMVVDLVELLAARKEDIPIAVQITADHYDKYDAATRADIARLEAARYPSLTLIRETPSPEEYAANFPGSICLQPYDRAEFRDRVSGVTLDALAHGCPIVATAGTWSAAHDRAVRRRHRACRSRRGELVRRRDSAARGLRALPGSGDCRGARARPRFVGAASRAIAIVNAADRPRRSTAIPSRIRTCNGLRRCTGRIAHSGAGT